MGHALYAVALGIGLRICAVVRALASAAMRFTASSGFSSARRRGFLKARSQHGHLIGMVGFLS
jgi:hypothetical protein